MDDHIPVADFHIQASSSAAAIQKLVLKHEELFLVCDRRGDFPATGDGELGFYHEGTRHLRWLELRLNGDRPLLLNADVSTENDEILVGLTNADIQTPAGPVPRNTIYLDRRLLLYQSHLLLSLTLSSFHDVPCEVTVEWIFSADFRDVFEVRGMHRRRRGDLLGEEREAGTVRLRYRGLDGVVRMTQLTFDPSPLVVASNRAVYRLVLQPNEARRLQLTATATNTDADQPPPSFAAARRSLRTPEGGRLTQATRIHTDNDAFNALVHRSLVDLDMLMTDTGQGRVPYAGVPWYVAPFGRDSLITAFQLLPYQAAVAAGTLRFLAAWQGRTVDAFRDEEPGKILHEYRRGEMANCREIPFIPYYGTIDATPLFLMLLAEYARWTGDLALVRELWPAARAALAWMREYGDPDGDGFLEYATYSSLGLGNQGWKDSEDAVSHADGALARAPIALVEVQGYAYAALRGAAELAHWVGDDDDAARLRREADALRTRFNRDFWLEHEGFYALALDADKRPCDVISSNPGHGLWTGIVEEARASIVAKRLLADDMFSGWGIRTLSSRERRYNPMSYHNGSVWPHDNALAAAGFGRYGLAQPLQTLMSALFDASRFFEHARIPELFCGFPRQATYGPISYPVACAPQAWAAGTVFQLLTAMCGFEADAPANRLTWRSPVLPPWLRFVEIHDLRVGSSSIDVTLARGRESASVELIDRRGDVEVVVRS
jgi:glycogen debranching enzyme